MNAIIYPCVKAPPVGEPIRIAEGVYLLRLPLPYALNHVNTYLLQDGDGWFAFDTGINNQTCVDIWERFFGAAAARTGPKTVIASHFHPDHMGLAAWFEKRFAARVIATEKESAANRTLLRRSEVEWSRASDAHLRGIGLARDEARRVNDATFQYGSQVSGAPTHVTLVNDGDRLAIGGRNWRVLTGGGHSPELMMLLCAEEDLFLCADQVLARISPNIGVFQDRLQVNPLRTFLKSLARLKRDVSDDVLALPGHDAPFFGLHRRIDELQAHHATRCGLIENACRSAPLSCRELAPITFERDFGPDQLSFAVAEVLAHVDMLVADKRLTTELRGDGAILYRAR